jgi:hypothetical protein
LRPLLRDPALRERMRRRAAARGAELSWASRYELIRQRMIELIDGAATGRATCGGGVELSR